jgi:hypothetical protein
MRVPPLLCLSGGSRTQVSRAERKKSREIFSHAGHFFLVGTAPNAGNVTFEADLKHIPYTVEKTSSMAILIFDRVGSGWMAKWQGGVWQWYSQSP